MGLDVLSLAAAFHRNIRTVGAILRSTAYSRARF